MGRLFLIKRPKSGDTWPIKAKRKRGGKDFPQRGGNFAKGLREEGFLHDEKAKGPNRGSMKTVSVECPWERVPSEKRTEPMAPSLYHSICSRSLLL